MDVFPERKFIRVYATFVHYIGNSVCRDTPTTDDTTPLQTMRRDKLMSKDRRRSPVMTRPSMTQILLLSALFLPFAVGVATGQQGPTGAPFVAQEVGTVCVLPAVMQDADIHLISPGRSTKSAVAASTIDVTYIDDDAGEPWPAAAITAFDFAKGIWEETVTSAVTIKVEAHWSDLDGCASAPISLGNAGPRRRWKNGSLPLPDTWYVDALADALNGADICGQVVPSCAGDPDIRAFFNRECDDAGSAVTWYFGTDGNTPAGHTDFVSVVLHELGHGLGFAGAGDVVGGGGTVLRLGFPIVFDLYTEDGLDASLLNAYADDSAELKGALEGDSSGVFFDATNANGANGGSPPQLYAPNPWKSGSSYSHLDETTFNGSTNALMTPQLSTMESAHVPGSVTCSMFQDMGWTISAANCDIALPVELAFFEAAVDGRDVLLQWETLSEADNAGFDIARSHGDENFRHVDFIAGAGSSVDRTSYRYRFEDAPTGISRFRIAGVDFDGTVRILGETEVGVALDGAFEMTQAYPNPFNPSATFSLTARASQPAKVEIFDTGGRRMAVLFDGRLESNSPLQIVIRAEEWPSGLYLYRVTAERFVTSGKVVLLK